MEVLLIYVVEVFLFSNFFSTLINFSSNSWLRISMPIVSLHNKKA